MKTLKIITAVIILALCFSAVTAMAADDITIYLNGSVVQTSNKPQIIDGTTLVPFRDIVEAMGGAVGWDADTKTVNITLGDYLISMQIDNKNIAKKSTRNSDGQLTDESDVSVIKSSVAPQIINGSTYIPLRALAEAVDADVEWNGTTKTITITTNTSTSGGVGYIVNGTTLTITGSGNMEDYEDVREDIDYTTILPKDVKKVVISNGITHIGNYSFAKFTNLESVEIPSSVTTIGDGAFFYCESLKSITIPNSVVRIGSMAFLNCSSLTSISVPNSVTYLSGGAFAQCYALTNVEILNAKIGIGSSPFKVFWKCSNIKTVTCKKGSKADDASLYPSGVTFNYI